MPEITLRQITAGDFGAVETYVVASHRQNDITPSSARRADGDTRFLTIPSEAFWSQQTWEGGYGRLYPPDPGMYWEGPADTVEAGVLRPAILVNSGAAPPANWWVKALCAHTDGYFYVAVIEAAGPSKLYRTADGLSLTFQANLPATVRELCSFRDKVWIAYGAAASVQTWDGTTLATPAPAFSASRLCAFGSMLFYAYSGSGAQAGTSRINRYDPENMTAVPDLAVLTRDNVYNNYVRRLVALGSDLYVVCTDALYKFTSQNGNSGVLAGPLDTWVPQGEGSDSTGLAGYGAAVYHGALIYSTGCTLRRHQPGGGSRQIWPTPPNVSNAAFAAGQSDATGHALTIGGLQVVGDLLYLVAGDPLAVTLSSHAINLLCWNEKGMHHVGRGWRNLSGTFVSALMLCAARENGVFLVASTVAASAGSGTPLLVSTDLGTTVKSRDGSTVVRSSLLDYGMLDIDKAIARFGVLAYVPNVAGASIALSIEIATGTNPTSFTSYPLVQVAGASFPDLREARRPVYFEQSASGHNVAPLLIGKSFRYVLTIGVPLGTPRVFPEVYAVMAIPNPVYPVRYGFRVEVSLGTHVRREDGNALYASQAAVNTALVALKTMRLSSRSYSLTWVDGATYQVRANTIAIVQDMSRGDEDAYIATLDLQEITG